MLAVSLAQVGAPGKRGFQRHAASPLALAIDPNVGLSTAFASVAAITCLITVAAALVRRHQRAANVHEAPSPARLRELRELLADLHHGLREKALIGDADAVSHVLSKAVEDGVSPEDGRIMANESYALLLREFAKPPWWRRARWPGKRAAQLSPPATAQRLGPGDPPGIGR